MNYHNLILSNKKLLYHTVHSYQGLHIQLYTPDDGCKKRLKHVEW